MSYNMMNASMKANSVDDKTRTDTGLTKYKDQTGNQVQLIGLESQGQMPVKVSSPQGEKALPKEVVDVVQHVMKSIKIRYPILQKFNSGKKLMADKFQIPAPIGKGQEQAALVPTSRLSSQLDSLRSLKGGMNDFKLPWWPDKNDPKRKPSESPKIPNPVVGPNGIIGRTDPMKEWREQHSSDQYSDIIGRPICPKPTFPLRPTKPQPWLRNGEPNPDFRNWLRDHSPICKTGSSMHMGGRLMTFGSFKHMGHVSHVVPQNTPMQHHIAMLRK